MTEMLGEGVAMRGVTVDMSEAINAPSEADRGC